jgi:hypothetical protein
LEAEGTRRRSKIPAEFDKAIDLPRKKCAVGILTQSRPWTLRRSTYPSSSLKDGAPIDDVKEAATSKRVSRFKEGHSTSSKRFWTTQAIAAEAKTAKHRADVEQKPFKVQLARSGRVFDVRKLPSE